MLTHDEARWFYDHFAEKQDRQGFYEDVALDLLVGRGCFEKARRVLELGCGTGRLAERLLSDELSPVAEYLGLDVSPIMVELARQRLTRFGERARCLQTDGKMELSFASGGFDRVVSTYLADLLSEEDIDRFLSESHRLLDPGGRLLVAGLTFGRGPLTYLVSRVWQGVQALSPRLVGGCRPLELEARLDPSRFEIAHHAVVSRYGIPSEVLAAVRR